MSWTDLGALGEILGAIAVVASLAYLSRQTRHLKRPDVLVGATAEPAAGRGS